jgi:O-succinylbenzoate synthase
MADANSSYTLEHVEVFKRLDDLDLMMIEQPLSHDDIVDHRKLQKEIRTPICLDESIHHAEDARKAIELGSCRIINIKLSRVGGPSEAKRIQALCADYGVPVWCGSMLESGIGEAFNIAVSTLPNYTIIGDVAPSDRYFTDDVITPVIELNPDGTIDVPSTPGLGVTPDEKKIKRCTVEKIVVD